MKNLYDTLGVDKDADPETIKKAYRKKARATHPDHGGDKEAFQTVALAFRILSDEEKRKRYDATGNVNQRDGFSAETDEQRIEAAAMAVAVGKVMAFLSKGYGSTRVIEGAKAGLQDDIRHFKGKISDERAIIKGHESNLKRIRRKSGANRPAFIERAIQGMVQDAGARIANLEDCIKQATKAIDLLDDYEDVVPPKPETSPWGMTAYDIASGKFMGM